MPFALIAILKHGELSKSIASPPPLVDDVVRATTEIHCSRHYTPGVQVMMLLFLFLLLVAPYLLLTLVDWWGTGVQIRPALRARVGLSLFFTFTAIGHFLMADEMSAMLPPVVPYRMQVVYLTGIFEFLGTIGVWIPRLRRLTGLCLILMLVCFLPVNIDSALRRVDFGGHGAGPSYLLLRVPFQLFLIWWTSVATEQWWVIRKPAKP
jgi:uncharacterized membrane protein